MAASDAPPPFSVSQMPQPDVRLVCDAAVQLACSGVATALQSVADQAAEQGGEGECFRASVYEILRDESRHAAPLTERSCARLCKLLDMPSPIGWQWQRRYDELVLRFPPHLTEAPPTPASRTPAAAAVAANIAAEAIGAEPHAGSATVAVVQCFGRQTVWCTVALLRRVLREARWPLAHPASADTEASLASLAVATVSAAAFGRRAAAAGAASP